MTYKLNRYKLFFKKQKYSDAITYQNRCLLIAKELGSIEGIGVAERELSEIYDAINDKEVAFNHYKKYIAAKDSLYNETKSKQIAEMQTKYEVKEKEKEIELVRSEKEVEKYRNYMFSGLVIFIAIIVLLLISRKLVKVNREKETVQIKQQLAYAEIARNKLEKQNLETSLLLHQEKLNKITLLFRERSKLIDKMEEQLDEEKNKTNQQSNVKQLLTSIGEYIDPNQYWEEFITSFNLVHKDFFNQLTLRFPDLTRNELRLSALIKCNLGNKEIANVLNITSDSVKKSRTRLRKKLQLEVDENLTKYLSVLN